jgi:transcriptional regulator with XRE-family HTH domain
MVATVKKEVEPIYRQFGSKIESMRVALGLSQQELSKRVGLTRTSVTNIEAGRQRVLLDDVEKFAAAFTTSPKFLMRGIWL